MTPRKEIQQWYQNLLAEFGKQGWWPVTGKKKILTARQKFEIAVGAILTQNTSWKNVERALANLHAAAVWTPDDILNLPSATLAELLRPAGYFRQKEKKLRALAAVWPIKKRATLLAVWGVGPETADSILLYAWQQPRFVIDAYTRRFCAQQGIHFSTYEQYQDFFQKNLPPDYKMFQEFHALLVAWGKKFRWGKGCGKIRP